MLKKKNRLILLVFLLAAGVACAPSKPAPTDDAATTCAGRCGMVNGTQCGPCEYGYTCNEEGYCVEIAGNDVDFWREELDEDTVDVDTVDRDMALTEHEYPDMLEDPYKTSYPDEDRNIAGKFGLN